MEGECRVAVVLPAGGCGERLGGCTPKQYCPVLGRPLISRTLEAFERVGWISDIVVVVAPESVDLMKNIIRRYGHKLVSLVEGGVTRHRSIFNGLRAFVEDHSLGPALKKPEVVIIHDAVRPFVDEETLLQVTSATRQYGAAGMVRPLVSTVIAPSSDGCLDHSLDRAKHRASEMPQAFLFDVLYKAYLQCSDYDLDFGTECLHLALAYSKTRAKLLEGPPDLWKVTYKRDLYAAESIIKDGISKHLCIITNIKEEAVQIGFRLHENLKSHIKVNKSFTGPVEFIEFLFHHLGNSQPKFLKQKSCKLIDLLQAAQAGASYQSVVVSQSGSEMQKLSKIRELAKEVQKSDLLLYGLLINFSKEESQLEDGARQASAIITALITDRNPALTGQVMVV
ncbi:hypothetical protein GDO78_018228 [Eleutherodactylus coqui]|uniref:D-ribitol-5-phosphate cytidylyltransferase n=1 Tax=Eleutherodactylus coqui TaxID=57060 RepID=A0A8J6JUZ7_ELECQ|nr:hypothetical protein GDO78_018228 [Eleutherodactylus coqui]